MDRSPSPPAPQPSVYADAESFMETVRRFTGTGQPAPTSAAAAAQRGAVVRMLPLEPVQQHQSMLAAATTPGPSASHPMLRLTLSPPLSWLDNPGPCILNMAPDLLSLATSSSSGSTVAEEVDMEDAEEVEMDYPEEVEAIGEGMFYLLPPPPPERNAGDGEPELLILFPRLPPVKETER